MTPSRPTMPAHARTQSNTNVNDTHTTLSTNDDNLFVSLGNSFDDLNNEDDEDLSFDDDAVNGDDAKAATAAATKAGKKSKLAPSTAEKKATHNAVERARRESLNARFLVLADMLPGMNHVKRASKAAIVNKSIDLIRNLRTVETKLAKENETLKEELNTLRQRLNGVAPASAPASAQPTTPAPAATMPPMFGLPGFPHPAAAGYPVMPGMPNPAALNGMPPHMQQQFHQMAAHQQAQMAHFAQAQAAAAQAQAQVQQLEQAHAQRSASVSSSHSQNAASAPAAPMPAFPGVFNGFFAAPAVAPSPATLANEGAAIRKSSGTPESVPATAVSSNTYFCDMWSSADANKGKLSRVESPTSYSSPGSGSGPKDGSSGSAPSPASSQSYSISTPLSNAYSPLPSSALAHTAFGNAGVGAGGLEGTSPPNPALAAFDSGSDPMFLATHFSTQDLVKAQSELSAFIAYQHRLSNAAAAPATPTTPSSFGNGLAGFNSGGMNGQQQQQQQNNAASAHQSMPNIPAWQMMMAQQQALTNAAFGQTAY